VAVVLAVACLVLLAMNTAFMDAGKILFDCIGTVAVVGFSAIGWLIASRLPSNAIGWLLCVTGVLLAGSLAAEQYALYGLATAPGSLPAVRQIGSLAGLLMILAAIQLVLLVLVFPDGRLPSRRWRPVLGGVCFMLAGAVLQGLQQGRIDGGFTNALVDAGVGYANPTGYFPQHGWFSDLLAGLAVIAVATICLTIISVFWRRRGAGRELRQQLAWLAYVGALTIAWVCLLGVAGLLFHGANNMLGTLIWGLMVLTPVVGIPVACAVAVLRYRLYDLDVVVRKTVVAGLVTAGFTAIYAVIVVGIGAITGRSGNSGLTFAAAAIAAVVFQPLRARAALIADGLVYGKRATPYEVLSDFAGRIAGTYSTEEVLPAIARMIAEATGAERAEVWLRSGGTERLETAWPAVVNGDGSAGARPSADLIRRFPVEHRGELLGALQVACSPREPLTPAGERLVRDAAAQAGLVLRNVGLIEDLRSSRQRIVAAADEARRGLERNLHDGAQQQLVALKITLGLARQVAAESSGELASLLTDTEHQAEQALADLRDLAHGIYPPLLADLGLAAALDAQARKAPVPVTVEAAGIGRYTQDLEAALYFSILEALQNVAKYAEASAARISLCEDGGMVAFTVADDGKGFDQATTRMGSGVQGIADRLAALGGSLEVSSSPGQGTRVAGSVPAIAG
jgi:signal transduction histidine kinase